jgi:hypothetical protein
MFDEEKLISLVNNYKSLYDKSDRFYDDNTVRENQWKEIAKEMNEQGMYKPVFLHYTIKHIVINSHFNKLKTTFCFEYT